jgi:hypothetical protein
MFIPFQTGECELNIPVWRPVEEKNILNENLLGENPEFIDRSIVYSVEEKFGISSQSEGNVLFIKLRR